MTLPRSVLSAWLGRHEERSGRSPNCIYFVRVRAVNACGASAPSNETIALVH